MKGNIFQIQYGKKKRGNNGGGRTKNFSSQKKPRIKKLAFWIAATGNGDLLYHLIEAPRVNQHVYKRYFSPSISMPSRIIHPISAKTV